jgi:hypothetical protein
VIHNPGNACAKERQGGEQSKVARLGVHFPNLKGQRPGCPSPVRELMALNRMKPRLPAAGRQAIFLETEPRAARPRRSPAAGATLVGQGRLAVSTNW